MHPVVPAMVFVNPSAGRGVTARKIAAVGAAFRRRNHPAQIVETASSEEFTGSVQAAARENRAALLAMGGDGTLQLLARETANTGVTVGVIPAGTGNDFAAALGIPTDIDAAVGIIAAGKTRQVDLCCAQFASGERAIYLGGGGIGLDAEAVAYAKGKFLKWRGRLRYLASAITALRYFTGVDVEAEFAVCSQMQIAQRVLLAVTLNTPTIGGGLRLAPDAKLDDGKLELVLLEMLSHREVLVLIPRLLLTGELKTRHVRRFQTAAVRLSATGQPWFQADGELLGRAPVEVRVLPRALRMLVP